MRKVKINFTIIITSSKFFASLHEFFSIHCTDDFIFITKKNIFVLAKNNFDDFHLFLCGVSFFVCRWSFQEQQTRKRNFVENKSFFKCCFSLYTKYLNFCVLWEDKQEQGKCFLRDTGTFLRRWRQLWGKLNKSCGNCEGKIFGVFLERIFFVI